MKVLVISHMYPSTFSEVSGIFVHEQVKALVGKGLEVRVVSPVPWTPFPINYLSPKWKAYSRIPLCSERDGIKIYYPRYLVFPRTLFFASSGRRMYQGIQKLVEEVYQDFPFDLIHAHTALPDGSAGMLLIPRYHKPLVVTIHGQDFQPPVSTNPYCVEEIRLVSRHASKIIVVSNKLKFLAQQSFQNADKIVVIPNGINPEDLAPEELSKGKATTILSVSGLTHAKGIDLNLQALAKLQIKHKNVRYVIIGDGPERTKLIGLARRLGILNQVEFLGFLPHKETMRYMAQCDIFSLPSWDEGFGIVYLEAMASGKPIIGCAGEGVEDFVEHKRTGWLVKPRDVDSLVEALDYLLSNPQEARAIGERARQVALQYTWERNAERTIEVYKEVLR
jgi:glycosyltransferase involved in cell wall biosynthesis